MKLKTSNLFDDPRNKTFMWSYKKMIDKWGWGFQLVVIDAQGQSSGLYIIWNSQVVSILNIFSSFIILIIQFLLIGSSIIFFLSNVYGPTLPWDKV